MGKQVVVPYAALKIQQIDSQREWELFKGRALGNEMSCLLAWGIKKRADFSVSSARRLQGEQSVTASAVVF